MTVTDRYSCFQKDIFNIVYLCESLHLDEVAEYWRGIIKMNEHQKQRFTNRIISCMFNNLTSKKIAVLGFAFKKDTSDTRESPAITLVNNLVAERAQVAIYDPKVKEAQIWKELEDHGGCRSQLEKNVLIRQSAYETCRGADGVVIMTEWDEFSNRVVASTHDTPQLSSIPRIWPSIASADQSSSDTATLLVEKSKLNVEYPALQSKDARRKVVNNIPTPHQKKTASLVIKNPTTGEIINFGRSLQSGCAKDSQPGKSQAQNHNYENASDARVIVSGHTALGDLKSTNQSQIREPFPSALKDISNNQLKSPIGTKRNKHDSTTPPGIPPKLPSRTGQYSFYTFPTNKPAYDEVSGPGTRAEAQELERLDWARIAKSMRKPMWVFDGRNILDADKLEALGFRVEAIGRASKYSGFG